MRGPVANLIKTGDRYALAIETALGAAAQNIVVDTQSCGAQAIELLRRRETGRATFLPLDTIRPMHLNSVPDQEPGYVGVADTLVTCAAAYRNIVSNLLGRTVVAETMKDAIAISKRYDHRYRIVTLDGQLVNAGGSLTGGSAAKGSGILSRANELKRLRAALDTLTLEKRQCEAGLEDAQTALDAAHAQLDTVQAQLEQAVETLHKAESEAAQVALLKKRRAGDHRGAECVHRRLPRAAEGKSGSHRGRPRRRAFGGAGARRTPRRARPERAGPRRV